MQQKTPTIKRKMTLTKRKAKEVFNARGKSAYKIERFFVDFWNLKFFWDLKIYFRFMRFLRIHGIYLRLLKVINEIRVLRFYFLGFLRFFQVI